MWHFLTPHNTLCKNEFLLVKKYELKHLSLNQKEQTTKFVKLKASSDKAIKITLLPSKQEKIRFKTRNRQKKSKKLWIFDFLIDCWFENQCWRF